MRDETLTHSTAWMAVLVTAAILFSFAMACGMPFAALGALAALTMAPRDAAVLAGLGWFANQAIGFGVLGYPLDATTIAWGGVLGLSALTGVGMALLALRVVCGAGLAVRLPLAFVGSWAGQQGVVVVAGAGLLASASATAPAVLWFMLWTNALAFAALLGVQWVGARAGLARPVRSAVRA